jgi:hypothetical protein
MTSYSKIKRLAKACGEDRSMRRKRAVKGLGRGDLP